MVTALIRCHSQKTLLLCIPFSVTFLDFYALFPNKHLGHDLKNICEKFFPPWNYSIYISKNMYFIVIPALYLFTVRTILEKIQFLIKLNLNEGVHNKTT